MSTAGTRMTWIGALLLAFTNAAALLGVAYNRQAPPESVLTLTERELYPQWSWMWEREENSGLGLRLLYRTEGVRERPVGEESVFLPYGAGAAAWLDRDKLAALGFDVRTNSVEPEAYMHYARMLGREVLLVLELDGPTYARALQAARDDAARGEADAAAKAQDEVLKQRAQNAHSTLQAEEHENSRLFVVDAGRDATALRQRYPDRARYAIVRGQVRPTVIGRGAGARIYGQVTEVRCADIDVPLRFHSAVPPAPPGGYLLASRKKAAFQLRVAFGRRFEPWIVAAHAGPG